jgi:hypothetical protein
LAATLTLPSDEKNLPIRLSKLLISGGILGRDPDSLHISFGEDNSFFAMDKDGFCWANLPPLLEEVLQESITLEGWKSVPKTVVLGVKGSCVHVNLNGIGHSDL